MIGIHFCPFIISSISMEIKVLIKKSTIIAEKPIGIDSAIILIGGNPSIPQKTIQENTDSVTMAEKKLINLLMFILNPTIKQQDDALFRLEY